MIHDEIDSVLTKLGPNWDKITNIGTTLRLFTSNSDKWHCHCHITLSLPRDTMSDWYVAIFFLKKNYKKIKNYKKLKTNWKKIK